MNVVSLSMLKNKVTSSLRYACAHRIVWVMICEQLTTFRVVTLLSIIQWNTTMFVFSILIAPKPQQKPNTLHMSSCSCPMKRSPVIVT